MENDGNYHGLFSRGRLADFGFPFLFVKGFGPRFSKCDHRAVSQDHANGSQQSKRLLKGKERSYKGSVRIIKDSLLAQNVAKIA
jgi:hypothetical protein